MAVVWQGLFDRFEPLDTRALIRAYFDRLFGWVAAISRTS
jgi:hypothetical protein